MELQTEAAGGKDDVQPEHDGPHILVVDDGDALLRIHARALASKGYRVETAPDAYPCTDPALDGSRGVTHLQLRGVDPLGLRRRCDGGSSSRRGWVKNPRKSVAAYTRRSSSRSSVVN